MSIDPNLSAWLADPTFRKLVAAVVAVLLGVAGAGVAFALQEVIASVAGRLAVSFGGFYEGGVAAAWGEIRRRYRLDDAVLEPQVTLIANDNRMEYALRYPVHYRSRRVVKDASSPGSSRTSTPGAARSPSRRRRSISWRRQS